jgi:hypothetical protein
MSLDDELQRALRPVDPGPEFTARVLAALDSHPADARSRDVAPATGRRDTAPRAFRRTWARRSWMWPALAASLVGAVVGARWFEERRETERGLAARTQLIQALRLTSEKLNVAREVIADQQR